MRDGKSGTPGKHEQDSVMKKLVDEQERETAQRGFNAISHRTERRDPL